MPESAERGVPAGLGGHIEVPDAVRSQQREGGVLVAELGDDCMNHLRLDVHVVVLRGREGVGGGRGPQRSSQRLNLDALGGEEGWGGGLRVGSPLDLKF